MGYASKCDTHAGKSLTYIDIISPIRRSIESITRFFNPCKLLCGFLDFYTGNCIEALREFYLVLAPKHNQIYNVLAYTCLCIAFNFYPFALLNLYASFYSQLNGYGTNILLTYRIVLACMVATITKEVVGSKLDQYKKDIMRKLNTETSVTFNNSHLNTSISRRNNDENTKSGYIHHQVPKYYDSCFKLINVIIKNLLTLVTVVSFIRKSGLGDSLLQPFIVFYATSYCLLQFYRAKLEKSTVEIREQDKHMNVNNTKLNQTDGNLIKNENLVCGQNHRYKNYYNTTYKNEIYKSRIDFINDMTENFTKFGAVLLILLRGIHNIPTGVLTQAFLSLERIYKCGMPIVTSAKVQSDLKSSFGAIENYKKQSENNTQLNNRCKSHNISPSQDLYEQLIELLITVRYSCVASCLLYYIHTCIKNLLLEKTGTILSAFFNPSAMFSIDSIIKPYMLIIITSSFLIYNRKGSILGNKQSNEELSGLHRAKNILSLSCGLIVYVLLAIYSPNISYFTLYNSLSLASFLSSSALTIREILISKAKLKGYNNPAKLQNTSKSSNGNCTCIPSNASSPRIRITIPPGKIYSTADRKELLMTLDEELVFESTKTYIGIGKSGSGKSVLFTFIHEIINQIIDHNLKNPDSIGGHTLKVDRFVANDEKDVAKKSNGHTPQITLEYPRVATMSSYTPQIGSPTSVIDDSKIQEPSTIDDLKKNLKINGTDLQLRFYNDLISPSIIKSWSSTSFRNCRKFYKWDTVKRNMNDCINKLSTQGLLTGSLKSIFETIIKNEVITNELMNLSGGEKTLFNFVLLYAKISIPTPKFITLDEPFTQYDTYGKMFKILREPVEKTGSILCELDHHIPKNILHEYCDILVYVEKPDADTIEQAKLQSSSVEQIIKNTCDRFTFPVSVAANTNG
ncbi:MAG: hypothetical protein VX112_04515 [Pseudomonadota bacterium]|nr:hypothetical protein [Pseudomonadota bacterium]